MGWGLFNAAELLKERVCYMYRNEEYIIIAQETVGLVNRRVPIPNGLRHDDGSDEL